MFRIYNTLTKQKEDFRPLKSGQVGLYTCGPTVYGYAHIGNLRTYIFEDLLRRTLENQGYQVSHIMNITDVDDKTIAGSQKAGLTLKKFTRNYEKAFKKDLKKLAIRPPLKFTRATEYIPQMIKLIQKLLDKGVAYQKEGSVYFNISKFKNYGRLSGHNLAELKLGARVDADEYKENVADFALWKSRKGKEPYWRSPFGPGRPGWHIECSAMSMRHLGETFDIHAAGIDLVFPHHENEIAQSEAATDKTFVNYWVHGEHLMINGEKMSKSLGNLYTLRDIEEKRIDPLAYRYLVLTCHYRSRLNFTWNSLEAAQNTLKRLREILAGAIQIKNKGEKPPASYAEGFKQAMANDLDSPKAIAFMWEMLNNYNKQPGVWSSRKIVKILYEFDKILGLGLKNTKKDKIPDEIKKVAEQREFLRKEKRWAEADKLRKKIEDAGWEIKDTEHGTKLIKK